MIEPHYEDDESLVPTSQRKYHKPDTRFQQLVLEAAGARKFSTQKQKNNVKAIEKAMMSLKTGIVSVYPSEWIENRLEAVKFIRSKGSLVSLDNVIKSFNNQDKKDKFVLDWQKKNPDIKLKAHSVKSTRQDDTVLDDDVGLGRFGGL